jgi:hypothetical protein
MRPTKRFKIPTCSELIVCDRHSWDDGSKEGRVDVRRFIPFIPVSRYFGKYVLVQVCISCGLVVVTVKNAGEKG